MPVLLPVNLGCVANFADKKESGARWAVTGVQVEDKGDGYSVVATDCASLIVVEGTYPTTQKPEDYPLFGLLEDARNGGTKTLIPAKLFADTMKDAAKNTKRCTKPILQNVAVVMADEVKAVWESKKVFVEDEDGIQHEQLGQGNLVSPAIPAEVVMGWTNLDQESTPKARAVEGRFPPVRDVIPKKSLYTVVLDPANLIKLGRALEQMKSLIGENARVELGFTSDQKPLVAKIRNEEMQQDITIIIMQLAG